jgi:hypothetical protein
MIHRRGVLPAIALLALVAVGVVLQILRGPAVPATPGPDRPRGAQPTPAAVSGKARAVLRSLDGVERAYVAGNVERLCRPGALVDPAVIRAQNDRGTGCMAEIESLIARDPSLRLIVRGIALRPDLATVDVSVGGGAGEPVAFVRHDGRWLLSFSNGDDPMPVLTGAP